MLAASALQAPIDTGGPRCTTLPPQTSPTRRACSSCLVSRSSPSSLSALPPLLEMPARDRELATSAAQAPAWMPRTSTASFRSSRAPRPRLPHSSWTTEQRWARFSRSSLLAAARSARSPRASAGLNPFPPRRLGSRAPACAAKTRAAQCGLPHDRRDAPPRRGGRLQCGAGPRPAGQGRGRLRRGPPRADAPGRIPRGHLGGGAAEAAGAAARAREPPGVAAGAAGARSDCASPDEEASFFLSRRPHWLLQCGHCHAYCLTFSPILSCVCQISPLPPLPASPSPSPGLSRAKEIMAPGGWTPRQEVSASVGLQGTDETAALRTYSLAGCSFACCSSCS